jgi:hypothetical protein
MAFLLSFPQRGFQKADRKIRETNIGETRGIVNLGSIGGKENPPVLAPLVEIQAGGFSGHHPWASFLSLNRGCPYEIRLGNQLVAGNSKNN